VILLILILMSILRTALDIASRAIAVMRARSRGWWLTGTPWGPLLQGVVALVQWTLARRRASSRAAGRVMEDKEDREGTTPAGTRLLIRSSPDRGSVLLHRDQHFIERESYRSGREMALEIQDRKRDGIGNPGQELVYHLYYLPPALCNGKQSLRAKFPTLSHTKQV